MCRINNETIIDSHSINVTSNSSSSEIDLHVNGNIESTVDNCDSIDKCRVNNETIIDSDNINFASNSSRSGNDFKSVQPTGTNHVELSNDLDLPTRVFPKDKFGRSFQTSCYWKSLPDNINVRRDSLSYSISSNKMFCHHCLLFGRNTNKV
ncbi:uncharacterized protein LOC132947058 [Metopolophium dirhodum]|uniref:uncharacterized protein LOC132947058 n=1 Tax=Metopolophium dirhodum TaxID=44670 RepID=UPI00298F6650|nr:uncharacterized protein LOC132947058 [Metopolophium dirhodum]